MKELKIRWYWYKTALATFSVNKDFSSNYNFSRNSKFSSIRLICKI